MRAVDSQEFSRVPRAREFRLGASIPENAGFSRYRINDRITSDALRKRKGRRAGGGEVGWKPREKMEDNIFSFLLFFFFFSEWCGIGECGL